MSDCRSLTCATCGITTPGATFCCSLPLCDACIQAHVCDNGDQPCTEHRPVAMAAADTGETVGWICGECGFGMLNAAALVGRTHIPIDPIPSRSIPGEVEQEWKP